MDRVLDFHRLRIFRSVVASGSVHAAADYLGFTPSAISQHLTVLQRETGLALFEKAGRGIRPTPAGLALAAEADELLARFGATEALVADLRAGRTGSLSIAYFASVGAIWLPSLVETLTRLYPGLRIDLRLSDDPDEQADVRLIVAGDDVEAGAGFVVHHLRDDPFVAAVPASHPIAARTEVGLAELEGERWIDNDFARGRCRRILLDACATVGFQPTFHIEAHDYPTALAFVAAGVGITVLPELGAGAPPPGVRVVPIVRPTPVRSIHAVMRSAIIGTGPGGTVKELLLRQAAGPIS